MYDPEQDIRDHYRAQINNLTVEILATNRRDPRLHKLHADRKLVQGKLNSLETEHFVPQGALRDYGAW